MMSPDELFRFLLQYLFRGSAQPSQIFLKSSKLLIIYIPFDMKVFRIAYISFNFDFVSFIKIYGIFYLVVDKQKSRSNGVYRDGIGEFVMMGILPDVAKDLGISIPTAGHFISAYALGVCVGAPVLTLARKYPLKHILLVLVTLIMIGNICATMAPNYWVLLAARFISGLPHGAYFGVGSIVAEKLADKGKGSEAVSIMIAGMTIANLFGVPLGTSLSTMLS